MKKKKTNKKKKINISNSKIISLIILGIILIILIILIGYKIYNKYLCDDKAEKITNVEKQVIELTNYEYYLHGNATDYEKKLAENLKTVLTNEEINWEEYAKVLTQMFISDLFTLNNKNGSSDITSSQYVYSEYQSTYEKMVKDTIYASIEINLDGGRTQSLPAVTNVEITSVTNNSFSYNNKILDSNAYYVKANIEYDKEQGYPTNYEVVLIKNGDLLQIVKATEL